MTSPIEGQVSLNAILMYEKEIKQRDERIKELEKDLKWEAERGNELADKNFTLEQELDAVKQALRNYGQHTYHCDIHENSTNECSCGFSKHQGKL